MKSFFIIAAATALMTACTSEQAYNSVKGYQQDQCNRRVDNRDREQCLKDADTNYDEYQKQKSQ